MSDLLRSKLLIQETPSAPFSRAPRRSFAHPCMLESALGGDNWQHQQSDNSPNTSSFFANAAYNNGNVFGEMESCAGFGEGKPTIEVSAFGFVEQRTGNQAFKGGADCRALWMHNSGALLPQMHAHKAENGSNVLASEQSAEMELSRRLILRPDAACLASPGNEGLDPKMLQQSASIPSLSANGWNIPMNASNLGTRFMQQQHNCALGTVDSHESVAQYPLDTAFAERAAKFTSFSSETYSGGFSNSPPLLHERRGVMCGDGSNFHQLEGQNSPKKMGYASPGMSSPVADRRTVKFALASPVDVKAPKSELPEESISDGGNLVDDNRQLCSSSARVDAETNGFQQIERQQAKSPDDTTSNPPLGHSAGDNVKPQEGLRHKRSRAAENQEKIASLQQQNQGKVVKSEEQVLEVAQKRQKSAPTSRRKQERKMDDEKMKNNESGGESSPKKPGTGKGTPPADLPKPDFIHVRARRGQATDSHSLAERVRREKISERMRFLQDLVPGCSKITGKAMMLDEIINYVQSLQHQVEFLAMKLAALNPILDFNTESFMEGEMASALAEVNAVPDMATSLGPHTPNYHAQMHTISAHNLKSGDVTEYAVPIAADNCNNLDTTDRVGFSHGNSWKGVGNVSGNLAFDEKIMLASSRVYHK